VGNIVLPAPLSNPDLKTMDFSLTPEQDTFRDSLKAFGRDLLAPHYRSSDREARFKPGLLREMAGMGLTGLRIPEAFGGSQTDAVTVGVAAETIAYADLNAAYLILNSALIGDLLMLNASEDQKSRWLPGIASGTSMPALCLTEPDHGSDAANIRLRADKDVEGWRLHGEKTSISLGAEADMAILFARTGGEGARGVSAFYVELDARHVQRQRLDDIGNRAPGRASLFFDGLPVGRHELIGEIGGGFTQVMKGFDYSRAIIGLMCIGLASAALDDAVEYARQRRAFGSPIGKFQGVAFPLAEHATYLRGARHICYEALWRKDRDLPHSSEAAMAKWWAPKASVEAIHQALLTFGHAGWSSDNPQGQRMRDAMGFEIADGTAQIAKLVLARQLLGREFAP
jgi:cyclohexanecarboxyl-CoA dehydrogenase